MRRTGRPGRSALDDWRTLPTDEGATFDKEVALDAATLRPARHLGHQPGPGGPRSTATVPDPDTFADAGDREPPHAPSSTWAWPPAPRCATSPSTPCSSARAPTAASRTSGPPPACSTADTCHSGMRALVVPGSHRVKAQAEAEGLDAVFVGGRLRMARARVLDVPGHEPGQAGTRASGARRPPTATSRDARAAAAAPTWSRRPWRPPPPSPGTSPAPEDLDR